MASLSSSFFVSSVPFKMKQRIKKKLREELIEQTLREELLLEVKKELVQEMLEEKIKMLEHVKHKNPEDDHEDAANAIDREVKELAKDGILNDTEKKEYIARLKIINT